MPSPKKDSARAIAAVQARLTELAEVLSDISSCMKQIADQRRGGLLALEQGSWLPDDHLFPLREEKVDRAKAVSRKPTSLDPTCGVPRIRYAQYVEFSSLEEFLKFKDLPAIGPDEVSRVDWARLEQQLGQAS